MSISVNFTYKNIQHNVSLEITDSSSEKDISFEGRNYKILGNVEDVSLLRSHIASLKTNDFENLDSFRASLAKIGPHAKMEAVFQKTIHETVEKACELIKKHYIFPNKAEQGIQQIKEKLMKGNYDKINDLKTFSDIFSNDLRKMIQDNHFDIDILPPEQNQKLPDENEWISKLEEINFGFDVEKNSENVGILKLYEFKGVDLSHRDYVPSKVAQKTREALNNAIDTMRGSDSIIIDMRENGGGSPYGVQYLISYFLPEQTQLNTIRSRDDAKETIQEFNTLSYEELPKEKRLLDVPIYILTSEKTFSAAEEFTYDMQVLGRGVVIGETTGGGANPCHLKPLNNEGLHIAIPDEEAINPHTKTNWEGKGVSPTHHIAADHALDKANELIRAGKQRV